MKGNPFEFSQTFENIKIIVQHISKVQLEHEKKHIIIIIIISSMEKSKN